MVKCRLGARKFSLLQTYYVDSLCTTPIQAPAMQSSMTVFDHEYLCHRDAEMNTYLKVHCGEDAKAALVFPTLVSPKLYPNKHCGGSGVTLLSSSTPPSSTKRQQVLLNRCMPFYRGNVIDHYVVLLRDSWSPNGGLELTVQTFAKADVNCSHASAQRRSVQSRPYPPPLLALAPV